MADVVFTTEIDVHCFIGGRKNPQCEALPGAKLDLISKLSKFGLICRRMLTSLENLREERERILSQLDFNIRVSSSGPGFYQNLSRKVEKIWCSISRISNKIC